MGRATKSEIREVLTAMKSTIRELEDAITADDGDQAAIRLDLLDEQFGMAAELVEDRYPDSFEDDEPEIEIEAEEVP